MIMRQQMLLLLGVRMGLQVAAAVNADPTNRGGVAVQKVQLGGWLLHVIGRCRWVMALRQSIRMYSWL
jgi:hypothetical protein